jgi:riboflavin biosynthesis pyrimidine reductase
LNVIVTAQGEMDLSLPVFQSGEVPVLLVTTTRGAQKIHAHTLPSTVHVTAIEGTHSLKARDILAAVKQARQCEMILVEGGPHLMGDFFAGQCLDELFLTLTPQVAGRDDKSNRPGLIEGQLFAPDNPRWGTLIGVKRAENYLFLRYAFTLRPHT